MKQEAAALYAAEEQWQTILESPEFFLHGMDAKSETFEFVKTDQDTLSAASFLDGRTPLSKQHQSYFLPISDVLDWHQRFNSATGVNRFIFHMSFCGSTLLARALEQQQAAFTLKEPQILLELAELKAARAEIYLNKDRWQNLVSLVLSQHRKEWSEDEKIVVKPSNWANSMLPQLVSDGGPSRAIFLGISPLAFLTAVFRGGGERIQFTYSVLKHLATAFPEFESLIAKIESAKLTTADTFARLTLITHAIQCKAFDRLTRTNKLEGMHALNYQDLICQPQESLQKSVTALDLDCSRAQLNRAVEDAMGQHSKVTHRSFDLESAQTVDDQVRSAYQKVFADAFAWADQNLDLNRFN